MTSVSSCIVANYIATRSLAEIMSESLAPTLYAADLQVAMHEKNLSTQPLPTAVYIIITAVGSKCNAQQSLFTFPLCIRSK